MRAIADFFGDVNNLPRWIETNVGSAYDERNMSKLDQLSVDAMLRITQKVMNSPSLS